MFLFVREFFAFFSFVCFAVLITFLSDWATLSSF